MSMVVQLLRAAIRDHSGVSSIEYGVLAIGLIAAVTAAMTAFSGSLAAAFTALGGAITGAF